MSNKKEIKERKRKATQEEKDVLSRAFLRESLDNIYSFFSHVTTMVESEKYENVVSDEEYDLLVDTLFAVEKLNSQLNPKS